MSTARIKAAVVALGLVIALAGCAAEPNTDVENTPKQTAPSSEETTVDEPGDEPGDDDAASAGDATTMPPGARPGSVDFPFPVPEGWAEVFAFSQEKVGKTLTMTAGFEYPGDAKAAAAGYTALLKTAGFSVEASPLGETVHDASIIVKGNVAGAQYAGSIDFDTMADGVQTAVINLGER